MVPVDAEGRPATNGDATHLRVHRGEWIKAAILIVGFAITFGGAFFSVMAYVFVTDKQHVAAIHGVEVQHAQDMSTITGQLEMHLQAERLNAKYETARDKVVDDKLEKLTKGVGKLLARIPGLSD